MFLKPLLTPSAMGREVNAVDSENNMNSIDDDYLLEYVEKSLSRPGHAHTKFRCGTRSLGDRVL